MKTRSLNRSFLRSIRLTAALLAFFVGALSARAQSFSIDWHSVDGGGGTSEGLGFPSAGASASTTRARR